MMKRRLHMSTPKEAGDLFQKHLQETSAEKFLEEAERLSAPRPCDESSSTLGSGEASLGTKLVLFQPEPAPLPLEAYLASALTGLDSARQKLIFELSERISRVCAEHGIKLYEPGKVTHPDNHADVTPASVFKIDREKV